MPQYVEKMTDHALVVELMAEEMLAQYETDTERRDELTAELERRHPGANERLAEHVTGYRMTSTETVVWAGAHWEEGCRAVVVTPTPTETAWVVEKSRKGRVRMTLCPLDEAMNAIASVKPDQLITDAKTLGGAFLQVEKYHPGPDIAAYIVDEGDGHITIAV